MTTVTYNLSEIKREIAPQVERAIRGITGAIDAEIKDSFSRPKTGRVYRRRGRVHRASAPGEPPAIDTRALFNSMSTSFPSPFKGVLEIADDKAENLEEGTSRTAARPFVRPAIEKIEREFRA